MELKDLGKHGGVLIAALKGKMGKKSEPEVEETEGEGNDQGKLAAAEEMLAAIKAEDAQALADALGNLFTILDSEPHVEGGAPDED